MNHQDESLDDSRANIVVKELMGRNLTIVKTNAKNNTPKTVEEILVTKTSETTD